MKIREAKENDKFHIFEFCKNTFSWGDYIEDVWNNWFNEKHLFVVENSFPIGMCHAFFSKNQVWIEGIRINPNFRRQGLASKLVKHVEAISTQKNILFSLMLIDTENISSLLMAQNLNYKILETWNFYSLLPQCSKTIEINSHNMIEKINFSHYVKSWRWLPLDIETLLFLQQEKKLLYFNKDGDESIAILTDSEHFDRTLIVTLFAGSTNNTLNLLSNLQNYGHENNYQRIQILSKEQLPIYEKLEHKISFHLMKKILR